MLEPRLAQYDGDCGLCGEPIREAKDEIVRIPADGEWVHAQCGAEYGFVVEGYIVAGDAL